MSRAKRFSWRLRDCDPWPGLALAIVRQAVCDSNGRIYPPPGGPESASAIRGEAREFLQHDARDLVDLMDLPLDVFDRLVFDN